MGSFRKYLDKIYHNELRLKFLLESITKKTEKKKYAEADFFAELFHSMTSTTKKTSPN